MINAIRVCPKCGEEIPADAPEGGCPGCLLQAGLCMLAIEDQEALVVTESQHATRNERVAKLAGDFGDYELLEEIGRGGQGIVYLARQKSLNRTVALKVISPGQWASKAHLKRFRREAQTAASLDHPNIVSIYDVGERDGSCYFSMKFIEGGQLDEVVGRAAMSIRQAVEIIAKLSRTVHYAHQHGILHRDIKPGNILLDTSGEPHLADFGLARLVEAGSTVTRTEEMMGTPSYMAPEQAVGGNAQLTSATDVYGLGAVLYQMLTGQSPFVADTTYETIRLLLETEPREPRLLNRKIDRELSTICLKCLEKDPKRRYPSALALAEDLEHWLKHEPIQAKRSGFVAHSRKWVQRNPAIAALVVCLIALAAAVSWNIWESELVSRPATKSVAVLPFTNLSEQGENAIFADGVQDEILTNLARIADLKVISRASTMQYKSEVARNLRKIARELGVANVVEGTVQRAGNRVRVNATLIDARNDRQLWGQSYDREVADVFAIQREIATSIAQQLQARLSPREKTAIEQAPTNDVTAFELYARADLLSSKNAKPNLLEAADLLNQAVARDPSFFKAYCLLASTHDQLYFLGHDHTPARLALAEAAIDAAFRLRPDAGETHLARAQNLYRGYLDYDAALAELEVAARSLPNSANVFELKGYIERRQGKQEEAMRSLERAIDLDPRNSAILQQIALTYRLLHRYAEQTLVLDRTLAIDPDNLDIKLERAAVDFYWKADSRPLHQMVDSIRAANPAAAQDIAEYWLFYALAERDAAAAKNAVLAAGEDPAFTDETVNLSRSFMEGVIARMTNDDADARAAFTAARVEQQNILQAPESYGPALCVLGLIDAGLGRKEDALREGRRAVELLPVEKDAIHGTGMVEYFAMIAAWVGEKDLACEQLAIAVRPPSPLTYGHLKLLPYWDPLRGDPRFEKIVASLAPK